MSQSTCRYATRAPRSLPAPASARTAHAPSLDLDGPWRCTCHTGRPARPRSPSERKQATSPAGPSIQALNGTGAWRSRCAWARRSASGEPRSWPGLSEGCDAHDQRQTDAPYTPPRTMPASRQPANRPAAIALTQRARRAFPAEKRSSHPSIKRCCDGALAFSPASSMRDSMAVESVIVRLHGAITSSRSVAPSPWRTRRTPARPWMRDRTLSPAHHSWALPPGGRCAG